MIQYLAWEGFAVFTCKSLSKKEYESFINQKMVSYLMAKNMIENMHDTPYALPLDLLNEITGREVVNIITYGKRWNSFAYDRTLPSIGWIIKCKKNNAMVDYYNLPLNIRKKIASDLILTGERKGVISLAPQN